MCAPARSSPCREIRMLEMPEQVREEIHLEALPEVFSIPMPSPIQPSPASQRRLIKAARRETMPNPSDSNAIKITAEDLAGVAIPEAVVPTVAPTFGAKVYGTINETAEQFVSLPAERGSILLQGWFYVGLAGMLGAVAGWGIAEPGFVDGPGHRWGNFFIIPLIVTLMCIGFGVSESIVERSVRKALLRGALALPLGILLGLIFDMMAETIYGMG